ncbi:hypothetical protein M514_09105 [Trichuris suis]|uniref:Phosphatidylinositol 3,4,5-trisphosphate 3-phosphatase and dual-specificity protein phosphatase PTEN n=1 Tax=Trichuris suis TaxID=68888 RepID=A0A085N5J8_9BILA|nr:hypothetical protein M514_09105 [Trichuris suis]
MAAKIRCLVSKNKRRYQEGGFDLDLSYIRPNIIAMGFPAEKLEGVFRNHIDDVVSCNERCYNASRFNNRVAYYPFVDHQPPCLENMLPFCEDVHQWLSQDSRNVVAIHCKAGKGRTGVMICAYLLYVGEFTCADEALEYYGQQRTVDMNGVTIPSQRRYVGYFSHLLRNNIHYSVVPMVLRSIELENAPVLDKAVFSPYVVISSDGRPLYKSCPCDAIQDLNRLRILLSNPIHVEGDVRVDLYHKSYRLHKKERLFHFWFNTFFLSPKDASSTPSSNDTDGACQPGSIVKSHVQGMAGRTSFSGDEVEQAREFADPADMRQLHLGIFELDQLKYKSQKIFPDNFKVCVTLSSCADSRRPTSPVRLNLEDPTDRQCAPNGPKTSLSDASDDSENSAYAEEDSDVDVRGSTGLCMPSGCHRLQVNNSLDDESASLNNRPSTLQGEQPNAPCYPGSTMFGGSAWVSDGAADLTVDVGVTPTSISV